MSAICVVFCGCGKKETRSLLGKGGYLPDNILSVRSLLPDISQHSPLALLPS